MVQSRFTRTHDPERNSLAKLLETKQRGDTVSYEEMKAATRQDTNVTRAICRKMICRKWGDAISLPLVGWRIPTDEELVTVSAPKQEEKERGALVAQIDIGRRVDVTGLPAQLVKLHDHKVHGAARRYQAQQEDRRQVKFLAGGKKELAS